MTPATPPIRGRKYLRSQTCDTAQCSTTARRPTTKAGSASVVSPSIGPVTPVVALSDINIWHQSERHELLTSSPYEIARRQEITIATRIEEHWKRFLTPQFQALIAYRVQRIRLSFPPTARYSITATPADKLQRSGKLLPISSPKHLDLAVAAANTHTAYA